MQRYKSNALRKKIPILQQKFRESILKKLQLIALYAYACGKVL